MQGAAGAPLPGLLGGRPVLPPARNPGRALHPSATPIFNPRRLL